MSALLASQSYFFTPQFVGAGSFTFLSRCRFHTLNAETTVAIFWDWDDFHVVALFASSTDWHVDNSGNTLSGTPAPTIGPWYDYAYRYESGGDHSIRVNGVTIDSDTHGITHTGSAYCELGGTFDGGSGSGAGVSDIDFYAYFNRVLSDAECDLWRHRRRPAMPGLQAFYPLHRGTQRLIDFSGNGRHLTTQGSPADGANYYAHW